MSRLKIILVFCVIVWSICALSTRVSAVEHKKEVNSCVDCHAQLPGSSFVGVKSHSWKGSIHQKSGVTCDRCHGGNPKAPDQKGAHAGILGSSNPGSPIYYKNIPSTCGRCHGAEFYKFTQSLHYKRLESKGRGPECVTCHGSMVTNILTPDTIASVCEQCHNQRMGIFPYVPQKAKAVLLLLRESGALLEADGKIYRSSRESVRERYLREARSSLHFAKLDWHRFDLDAIIEQLQDLYNSVMKLQQDKSPK
jgi:hypothetical protein